MESDDNENVIFQKLHILRQTKTKEAAITKGNRGFKIDKEKIYSVERYKRLTGKYLIPSMR